LNGLLAFECALALWCSPEEPTSFASDILNTGWLCSEEGSAQPPRLACSACPLLPLASETPKRTN